MQALILLDAEACYAKGLPKLQSPGGLTAHCHTVSKVKGLSRLLWGHELSMMALVRLGERPGGSAPVLTPACAHRTSAMAAEPPSTHLQQQTSLCFEGKKRCGSPVPT